LSTIPEGLCCDFSFSTHWGFSAFWCQCRTKRTRRASQRRDLPKGTAAHRGAPARRYKGLEALHAKYKDRGLVVLGFPSNDFSQEPESNAKIADFCENTFGVKFPMFVKTTVKGRDALPLYKQLAEQTGTTPKWNFYKYVISRDGKDIKSYSSMTGPQDKSFVQEIEKQLAMKGATQ
jgi:glutathione peroxidase-family protein